MYKTKRKHIFQTKLITKSFYQGGCNINVIVTIAYLQILSACEMKRSRESLRMFKYSSHFVSHTAQSHESAFNRMQSFKYYNQN